MARAGRIVAATLALMQEIVRAGLTTENLDAAAEEFIRSHDGATPSFKGLYGFPKTLCTSIDLEIVHGIPSRRRVLAEGSIVSVDVGVQLEGLHADSATTIAVGEITPQTQRLLNVTQDSLGRGNRAGTSRQPCGRHRPCRADRGGRGRVRCGKGAGGPWDRHPIPRGATGAQLWAPAPGATPAGRDDPGHRADDHDRQPGHADAVRQVDRGYRRWKPGGPFRAHRCHYRRGSRILTTV